MSTKGPTLNRIGSSRLLCGSLKLSIDLGRLQFLGQRIGVGRNRGVELLFGRGLQMPVQIGALNGDILHLPRLDLVQQIGIGVLRLFPHACALRHDTPQQHQTNQDEDPEHDRFDG